MPALERVMQMKQQGIPESQIIESLKEEKISPKDINNALSQSQIKSEVNTNPIPQPLSPNAQIMQQSTIQNQMQPSIMPIGNTQDIPPPTIQTPPPQEPPITPQPMQSPQPISPPQPMQQTQKYTQTENSFEQYPEQIEAPSPYQETSYSGYEEYPEYQTEQSADIETMNDIAEQIAEEKNTKIKKQISSFSRFKEEITIEMNRIGDRLTAMENNFNNLQLAILKKIGSYGENIQNINKEMRTTQDSFSKILNPLTENLKELKKITGSHPPHHKTPTHHKKETKQSKAKKNSSKKSKNT